ncbi:MAG: hypothetical protein LBU83_05115 [Bacteroidales bacterium]|jgi:hypothetical protein|nr:hypothetical protein [Bacteroidales bacterium]
MLLVEDCTFYSLNLIDLNKVSFDCSNEDLNDFFFNDSLKYAKALLGRLGVNIRCKEQRQENTLSIGDQTLNFIKEWFLDANNKDRMQVYFSRCL